MTTPWGQSDHIEKVGADGILFASTPSHGGYYVPSELLHRIPEAHQLYAKRWGGSRNWYEEDCACIAVMLAFPELFPAGHCTPDMAAMLDGYVEKENSKGLGCRLVRN